MKMNAASKSNPLAISTMEMETQVLRTTILILIVRFKEILAEVKAFVWKEIKYYKTFK